MRKYPFDVSASKNCIDANLEMLERWDPDNFTRFPPQEWCAWTIPEIFLKLAIFIDILQIRYKFGDLIFEVQDVDLFSFHPCVY